jgi:hypothetical protein
MIKAVGLLSGGLDSTLAAKLMLDQGIKVHAINFTSPFCHCTARSAGCAAVVTAVRQLGSIPLERVALGEEYLAMIRHPKHGYGRGTNPCIDCRIMKLRKAGEYMRSIGASFLFTGEVLGQRPMSQHHRAFEVIDRESGLGGLILRPLSAELLEPTIPETEGWVKRDALLGLNGRTRTTQISMARDNGINDYPCPAGGCLLTDPDFAAKLREHFSMGGESSVRAMTLLQVGRHFRLGDGSKIVVSRNENEGARLEALAVSSDSLLVPDFAAPTVLLQGRDVNGAVAAMMRYVKKQVAPDASIRLLHAGNEERISAPAVTIEATSENWVEPLGEMVER